MPRTKKSNQRALLQVRTTIRQAERKLRLIESQVTKSEDDIARLNNKIAQNERRHAEAKGIRAQRDYRHRISRDTKRRDSLERSNTAARLEIARLKLQLQEDLQREAELIRENNALHI
jgi:predicted  nucleic acid-binding Zn-ribbon protein